MRRGASGFTLIELAIVVAIIGMIAAAIMLSGGGVFGRTGVASLLSNVKDLATASREFKARYGYFPGDMPNAGGFITANGGISEECNYAPGGRVGDGIVNDTETNPNPPESDCALEHLVKAGFLSKVEYDASTRKYFIPSTVGAKVRVSLWFNETTRENAIRITNLPCDLALDLDRKLDSPSPDNRPFHGPGAVTARRYLGGGVTEPIDNCTVGNPAEYDPVPILLIKY